MHSDERLWKLVDGELTPTQAEALEAEAAGDDALRFRIAEMRAIKREVLAGAPGPPAGFPGRVAARAITLEPAPVVDLADARRFLRRALVAAALAAAVGLAYVGVKVVPQFAQPADLTAGSEVFGR